MFKIPNVETHAASIVAGSGAVLDVLHPGFQLPPDTTKQIALVLIVAALVPQVIREIRQFTHESKSAKEATLKTVGVEALKAVEDGRVTSAISSVKTEATAITSDAKDVETQVGLVANPADTNVSTTSVEPPTPPAL